MEEQEVILSSIITRLKQLTRCPKLPEGWEFSQNDQLFSGSRFSYVALETANRLSRTHTPWNGQDQFRQQFSSLMCQPAQHQKLVLQAWGEALEREPDIVHKVEKWFGDAERTENPSPPVEGLGMTLRKRKGRDEGQELEQPRATRRSADGHETLAQDTIVARGATSMSSGFSSLTSLSSSSPALEPRNEFSESLQLDQSVTTSASVDTRTDIYEQEFHDASLEKMNTLFPVKLSSSVSRERHSEQPHSIVAGIDMMFSNSVHRAGDCTMRIRIKKEAVVSYARSLFGIHLEDSDGLRYVRFSDTRARVIAAPDILLSDCRRDVLDAEFGLELGNAIKKSPKYKAEERRSELVTESVCLKLSADVNQEAEIGLCLGFLEGTAIREKLYES